MDVADIRVITGDQGQGKSITGVAYATEDYHRHIDKLVHPDGRVLSTLSYVEHEDVWRQLHGNPLYHVIVSPPSRSPLLLHRDIVEAKGFKLVSPVKIFANFHLYRMKYMLMKLATLIEYLNSDLFQDGWILWDESTELDARDSMTLAGKIEAWFGASIRKRRLHYLAMTQLESMIEKRYRAFATTRVLCSYDKKTGKVTISIREKGERKKEITYNSLHYRQFYDTNERRPIPEAKLNRALAQIRGVKV